jgi:PIN domain nuclease of toxin-antitoxin system
MRLLLDTHFVLAVIGDTIEQLPLKYRPLLRDRRDDFFCSVASLWEIAIKARTGKLALSQPLVSLDETCLSFNLAILPIVPRHVLAEVVPEPATRDPFDRLLLAQAGAEGLQLVTLDRALAGHPLTYMPQG